LKGNNKQMNFKVLTLIGAVAITAVATSTLLNDAQAASRLSIEDRLAEVKSYRSNAESIRDRVETRMSEVRSRLGNSDSSSKSNTSTEEKPKDVSKDTSTTKAPAKSEPKQSAPKTTQKSSEPKQQTSQSAPVSVSEVAKKVHDLTNDIRRDNGLAPLAWDGKLASISDGHSKDMARNDYFSHTNRAGCSPSCRAKNAGYSYYAYGENIAMGSNSGDVASRFMKGWMNSSGHRRNILNDNYTHEGIGVAVSGGKIYVTVNFADPR
jgi:uncharacterized protein YkwD